MADRLLHWGLLSTARINRALIPPLRASKRNRLLAVASRTEETAEAYAREWKIPRAHGSYEALLEDPEIDVIYNPLPNSLHAEWTIKALRAGKHVLCEKPLAVSVGEVDAIRAASKETSKVVAEAFMYRHHAQTLRVKELVHNGSLGKLQSIKGSFTFMLEREGDVRLVKALGGGSIWDVGCYPISYARLIVGVEPLEVFGWQITGPSGIDMSLFGQMRFPNDVHVQFDCGFASPEHSFIEIIGAEGTLNVPKPFKPGKKERIYLTRQGKITPIEIKGEELYRGEVEDMADAILLGKPPRISLEDSRGNVAAIVALLESAQTGKPTAF
ncbi:MAG TPA: Gfo/Idh/MocA family oxidoreductase [Anaerolineales bacterium]|nr:Gfo/Idh/MocA family oxidoreductase [Anaerolineales bacterium]